MAGKWYLHKSGEFVGPFSSQQLKGFAVDGKLKKDDVVRKGDSGNPIPAGTVANLFSGDRDRPARPPALPESSPSTECSSQSAMPPPLPMMSHSKAQQPPPLPPDSFTRREQPKEPRSRVLLLTWIGALSFCFAFAAFMLPEQAKQVTQWLRTTTHSFVETVRQVARDAEAETQDADALGEQGGEEQAVVLSPAPGRELEVRVGTALRTRSTFIERVCNPSLSNVECHATSDEIIIDFDVDLSKWPGANWSNNRFPLLVRLFDRNGAYLTHFTTIPFTGSSQVRDDYIELYENVKSRGYADDTIETMTGALKCELLTTRSNRLIYNVNTRDLRDAALIEIGFTDR